MSKNITKINIIKTLKQHLVKHNWEKGIDLLNLEGRVHSVIKTKCKKPQNENPIFML